MNKLSPILFILLSWIGYAQKVSIEYESNGRSQTVTLQNPFHKFVGEWTLKNNDWTQNWGNGTETIKIPNHHTISKEINTDNSLLSIIDGPEPNGHIFWSFNPNTKEVFHLSSFGTIRAGNGKGTISKNGDIELKLFFEGEPKETYRIYNYKWISNDEYHMKSVQYDSENKPTGLFYQGNFVRINIGVDINQKEETISTSSIRNDNGTLFASSRANSQTRQIEKEILNHGKIIRKAFSDEDIEKLESLHHPDVVKALGYNDVKIGRDQVINSLRETLNSFSLEFTENIVENILIRDNMAIEQTKFSIRGIPKKGGEPFIFKGRTMVTYLRYDKSPTGWATIREIIQPAN